MPTGYDARISCVDLLRYKRTVWPLVFADPLFFMLNFVHVCVIHVQHQLVHGGEAYLLGVRVATGDTLPPMDWAVSTFVGSLLTFFLVFYGNACYTRYTEFYRMSIRMSCAVGDWAQLIRTYFGKDPPVVRWRLMRHFLGAMHVHYAYLGGTNAGYTSEGESIRAITPEEWRAIKRHNFLTEEEIDRLVVYRGSRTSLVIAWAVDEIARAIRGKMGKDIEG